MKPPRQAVCVEPDLFPATIDNRPSLGRIAYRIGTYGDARRHLLRALDADPVLAAWTYRGADDPGIALYEGAAELVDILTFYQEVYANEAYLRTATWRESVADLVRLTGYRLKPGIGGTGTFAIEVTGTAPVTVPAGSAITVDLADDPDTATFQTSAAATALPWLSRFALVRPQLSTWIENGATQLLVQDPALELAENDRLLVGVASVGGDNAPTALDPWEIVVVDSVDTWNGRALLTLKGPITKTGGTNATLAAFKLGETFHHFGHNAPSQVVTVDASGQAAGTSVDLTRTFTSDPDTGGPGANAYPGLAPNDLALDPQTTELALGTQLAIEITTFVPTWIPLGPHQYLRRSLPKQNVFIRQITDLRPVTARYGALTGPVTIASVDSAPGVASCDLREIQIDAITGAAFQVGAPWIDGPTPTGSTLAWWGDPTQGQTLLGRTIAIQPATADAYTVTVLAVVPDPFAGLSILTLDRDVPYADFASPTPTTVVFGNLIDATEGKAQTETTLGNGNDQQTFQSFQVPTNPLTYLNHAELTPPAQPEITIVVGNRIWEGVPSLYGQAADAEVYVVLQDNSGVSWVQFGDGKTGARVPSGVGNVRIRWRTGAGAYGPIKVGAQPSLAQRITGVSALDLVGPIEGGADPETEAVARVAAPARVQSLDRLVSVADIEAEALAIGGVDRARAAWAIVDGLPCVQVIVLMQAKRTADLANVQTSLATANRTRGPDRFPIQVVAGATEYVYLDLSVALDPTYDPGPLLRAVEAALGVTGLEADGVDGSQGLFGEQGPHDFGDAEYATRVEAIAQNVDGVQWAVVNAFGSLGIADDPSTLAYPAAPSRAETVPCASTRVLRLFHAGVGGPLILRTAPGATS